MARCRREIAEAEAGLRAGHADIEGLCLALADWSAELRFQRLRHIGSYTGQSPLNQGTSGKLLKRQGDWPVYIGVH